MSDNLRSTMGFIVRIGEIGSGMYFAPKTTANARVREEDRERFGGLGMHWVGVSNGASSAKNSQSASFFSGVKLSAVEGYHQEMP